MTKTDLEFNKNEDQMKQLIFRLRSKEKKTQLGGEEKKIETKPKELVAKDIVDSIIELFQ